MKEFILYIAVFCIIAAGLFTTTRKSQESAPDETPEQLLAEIEQRLSELEKDGIPLDPVFGSSIRFILARTYNHFGEGVKAAEHFSKITQMADGRIIVRPFLDGILMSARRGHVDIVVERIQKAAKIENIYGDPLNENTRHWLQKALCAAAAKKFAVKRNFKGMDTVEALPECGLGRYDVSIAEFRAAALVRDQKFMEAYQILARAQKDFIAGNLFFACMPEQPDKGGKRELLTFLANQKSFDDLQILQAAKIHAIFEEYPAALKLYLKVARPSPPSEYTSQQAYRFSKLNHDVSTMLFRHYYEAKDASGIEIIAKAINHFDQEPVLTGGFGARDPHQWWVTVSPINKILVDHPSDLGLDLAVRLTNDKTRFTVLKDMFLRLDKLPEVKFPNCDQSANVCIVNELEKIAERQTDPLDRNLMYRLLSNMAGLLKDEKRSAAFLAQLTPGPSTTCAYDMCGGEEGMKLRYISTQQTKPNILDKLLGTTSEELVITPAADKPLADLTQRLVRVMNNNWPDYRAISRQSGYAVDYIGNTNYVMPDHYGCPID